MKAPLAVADQNTIKQPMSQASVEKVTGQIRERFWISSQLKNLSRFNSLLAPERTANEIDLHHDAHSGQRL